MAVTITAPQSTLKRVNGVAGLADTFTALNLGKGVTGGGVIVHGARVGDTVIMVLNLSDPDDESADFETTVTVANEVQQDGSSADLDEDVLMFVLQRG